MRQIYIAFGLITLVILQSGCSRRIPSFSFEPGKGGTYDTATYDFIFTEAVKQKLLGNNGDAVKLLEQCIVMNPDADAAYFQISQIMINSGDFQNGKKYALKAYGADDKNIWYISLIAGIYYQEKKLDSAAIFYEKISKLSPDRDDIVLTLGNIYSEMGKSEKADQAYAYLESKYGGNESITMSQVKNLINSGNLKGAEEKIQNLLRESPDELLYNGILAEIYRGQGENEKALDAYKRLVEIDPADPQTMMSLSDFLLESKNYTELFQMLNTVILNDRIPKEQKIALIAKCVEDDTLVNSRGNDFELIVRVFEATYRGDHIVNLLRPEYYERAGRTDNAIKRLEEIIREIPENYLAWEKLLILYSDKRDYENLFRRGYECATKFNRSYVAKILYASAATEMGEYDIAIEEIRKAKILAGEQKELLVQALSMEADAYYRKKEYSKSFSVFKEALGIDPSDITVLNNYAYFLAELGQELEKAEEMARKVIEKEADNTTFLDTYAWVLYKRGKSKEAAKVMESVLKGGGEDADWFEHYGFIMKSLKKCDIAVSYWKRTITLDSKRQHLIKEIENCSKR